MLFRNFRHAVGQKRLDVAGARAYHRRREAIIPLLSLNKEAVKGAGNESVLYRLGRRDQGVLGPEPHVRVLGDEMVPASFANNNAGNNGQAGVRAHYELVADSEVETIIEATAAHFRMAQQQKANAVSTLLDPLVAPPSHVLERNAAAGNARFDFVFVDTGAAYTAHERRVLVREKDGTLRTAHPGEQQMYNQMFFPAKYEKRNLPPMFHESAMADLMRVNMHVDLLNEICRPDFINVHKAVYENIDSRRVYSKLQNTPHWTRFVDFLVARSQIEGLAMTLVDDGRASDAEALAAEFVAKNPSSRLASVCRKLSIKEPAQILRVLLQNVESLKKLPARSADHASLSSGSGPTPAWTSRKSWTRSDAPSAPALGNRGSSDRAGGFIRKQPIGAVSSSPPKTTTTGKNEPSSAVLSSPTVPSPPATPAASSPLATLATPVAPTTPTAPATPTTPDS